MVSSSMGLFNVAIVQSRGKPFSFLILRSDCGSCESCRKPHPVALPRASHHSTRIKAMRNCR
jgi:hypothetical protein